MRLVLGLVLAISTAAAAAVTPEPPVYSAKLTDFLVGVMCSPQVVDRAVAPNTALGYTNVVAEVPKFNFQQQVVPAALGVSFGVSFTSGRALAGVRNLTFRPGNATPDMYYSDLSAKSTYRGFGFETPDELVLGQWRLESWQGEELLYRVDFEVVSAQSLPDIEAQCQAMS